MNKRGNDLRKVKMLMLRRARSKAPRTACSREKGGRASAALTLSP